MEKQRNIKIKRHGIKLLKTCLKCLKSFNSIREVVELFGKYWHSKKITGWDREKEENKRVEHFAKFGFKTLIVWGEELKNILVLKSKVFEFVRA